MNAFEQLHILLCVMVQKPFWPLNFDCTQPASSEGHHKRLAIHPAAKDLQEELRNGLNQVLILLCVMAAFLAFYH